MKKIFKKLIKSIKFIFLSVKISQKYQNYQIKIKLYLNYFKIFQINSTSKPPKNSCQNYPQGILFAH